MVLVIQCVYYTATASSSYDRGEVLAFVVIVYGPIMFLTVLIRELGRCWAAKSVGGHADAIVLWPLGGLTYVSHDAGPKVDLWVTFAAALAHVPQIGFWALVAWLTSIGGDFRVHGSEFRYDPWTVTCEGARA